MRGRRLGEAAIGLHLRGVDQVGKLDRVLNEEHRNVVADQVPVAVARVEFDRETAHVARRVDRSRAARDGGEPDEHLGPPALLLEQVRPGDVGEAFVTFEITVRRGSARVDDTLGDALMVEMVDLLAIDMVLQQHGAARAGLELILIIRHGHAVIGGEDARIARGALMSLAAMTESERDRFVISHDCLC